MAKRDEPAFPRTIDSRYDEINDRLFPQNGMTIRQYAAIQAMAALIISPAASPTPENLAIDAVDYADALLARLEKETRG